jgi:hypothetical protein
MKTHSKLIHTAGLILFFAGIFIGVILAGGLTWAGLEANFYFGYGIQGDRALKVSCPPILAASDTGAVTVSISNPSARQVKPVIEANLSGPIFPSTSQIQIAIDPGQRQTAKWQIGSANVAFGRLILAQVYQYSAYPLSSAEGYCGTLVLDLHGLTGKQFFALFLAAGLLGMIGGFLLAALGRRLLGERRTEETGSMPFLGGLVLVGILAGVMGWWLLGVIAIALSLLLTAILLGRRIMAA